MLKLLPYPAASHPSGQILFERQDLLKANEKQLRQVRGNKIAMIFQEPMTSLNPLHTISQQVMEILKLHRGMGEKAGRAHAGAVQGSRHPRSGKAARCLSASTLRRPTPARDDRDGAGQRAGALDRRRTDNGAGCDRAGADPRIASAAQGKERHVDAVHHA
jgi:ABC-type dipeptide/oligopeptide/nickel transport system ATPase component